MLLFLCYSFFQILQLFAGALNGAPRLVTLRTVHLGSGAGQTPTGAAHDCRRHLQIAQQFAGWRRWWRFHLPLRFQPQFGLLENALACLGCSVAPGSI
jgi:hypothetical protein